MMHIHQFFDLTGIIDTPPIGVNTNEELRPVIFNGVVYPAYSVSNWGNVYSHKVGRRIDRRRAIPVAVNYYTGKINGRGGYSRVCLTLGKQITRHHRVHQLVMAAFRPVDEYPPQQIPLADFQACPESVKQWIRKTVIINHIDHNCHNNRLENLEYTTQHDNILKAVKYYGGHVNNKNLRKL